MPDDGVTVGTSEIGPMATLYQSAMLPGTGVPGLQSNARFHEPVAG